MQNESTHFNHTNDPMMACPSCGKCTHSIATLIVLEDIRAHFHEPITITSGARCWAYNKEKGGRPNSYHLVGTYDNSESKAVDFIVRNVDPVVVYLYINKRPYTHLLGVGNYVDFTHMDTRGHSARWIK
jgi:uncharacterized protein YcbK (DUF882 family)